MDAERQRELLSRLSDPKAVFPGPLGAKSVRNPATAYTSADRFERERALLFRGLPLLVGLSTECRRPGDYLTADLGGVPVFVIRQDDGMLRGFANICRHRAARLVDGCGRAGRSIVCPYHAWTYGLDGRLRGMPGAEAGFDDVDKAELGLVPVRVAEQYGLIFARSGEGEAFSVDDALQGAQAEIASYGIERAELIETRVQELPINWKLVVDTFTETYHIAALHKKSIDPHYHSDRWIVDEYGAHTRLIGVRSSIDVEFAKSDERERRLLPHATTQYLLMPNAVLVHQIDHFELWRVEPLAVDRTRVATSLFSPGPPASEKARAYFVKNLDVLLGVTNMEDFPVMAQIQRNLASGALPEVVYGKQEPALVHFHASVDALLAAG
jgi:phenylpropionate dioxygenase-like ring-hydroxylating dioxygenase large terminal subunit